MVLGSLTGSFCGGVQCGKFGRKKSLMIDSFIFIIGTLFVALSPNFYLILIGITTKYQRGLRNLKFHNTFLSAS